MTFQLQPPAQIWDEEITTDKWPLPPAKPWEPKSSIEQMCEEALKRLSWKLEADCTAHWIEHCEMFGGHPLAISHIWLGSAMFMGEE